MPSSLWMILTSRLFRKCRFRQAPLYTRGRRPKPGMQAMIEAKSYPHFRVVLGITSSPALSGLLMGLIVLARAVSKGHEMPHFWYWLIMLLPFIGISITWYGVPALLLGLIYACLRLYRTPPSLLLVTAFGGTGALAWSVLVRALSSEPLFKITFDANSFPHIPAMNDIVIFVAGAVCSALMGALVLPASISRQ